MEGNSMDSRNIQFGEGLSLLAVTLANAVALEFEKEDVFVIAAFLSAVAANLYVIGNAAVARFINAVGETVPGP